jgi:Trypsin-like peptidase domain
MDNPALKCHMRLSQRGHPFFVWELDVPRIRDDLLNSVAYLYPSEAEAEEGTKLGGSGFFVGINLGLPRVELLCLVTNKHVVDDGNMTVRINTPDGRFDVIALDGVNWSFHPDGDDLAVCPVGINTAHHNIRAVSDRNFLSKKLIDQYDVGVGDDVFMIGRFISREGKERNIPSVRFGAIAQMPAEPIILDGIPQESYLVAVRSIPGYSGSPVFITIPPAPGPAPNVNQNLPDELKAQVPDLLKMLGYNPKRQSQYQLGPWLVGIDYCHIYDKEKIFDKETDEPIPNMEVHSNTGMMGVIPAWRLTEILEGPAIMAVVNELKAAVERGKKKQDQASRDTATSDRSATDENPKHREDFIRLASAAARKQKQDE